MSEFKSWEEMSEQEQLSAIHYDFYKDVHGIRPRWMNYSVMSVDELKAELDQLQKDADRVAIEEAARQKEAIAKFEQHVTNTICMGARDRETALRWIMDASICNGDWEFLCYDHGLPYGYFKKPVDIVAA